MSQLETKCRKLVQEWRSRSWYYAAIGAECAKELEAILPKKRKRKAKK